MKHLLPYVQSIGPTIGVVICLAVFVGILFWVYRPAARNYFEKAGQLPLNDGDK